MRIVICDVSGQAHSVGFPNKLFEKPSIATVARFFE
jgi:hypothetical protein